MSTPPPPARLYAIFAREAPVAVVFRRGPARWVQIIKWNTDTDTFEPGQWFHGRIYEERSDLSPDGTLLVYFALPFKHPAPSYGFAWTAISKLPYLTALGLWPSAGTWAGGGKFITASLVQICLASSSPLHPNHAALGVTARYIDDTSSFADTSQSRSNPAEVWTTLQELITQPVPLQPHQLRAQAETSTPIIGLDWKQQCSESHRAVYGQFTLQPGVSVKLRDDIKLTMWQAAIAYRSFVRYSLTLPTGIEHILADATWADFDQRGRVVFARAGKLFAADIDGETVAERELADFNGNKFEPVESPEWAKHW